jgi:hypothetical protein
VDATLGVLAVDVDMVALASACCSAVNNSVVLVVFDFAYWLSTAKFFVHVRQLVHRASCAHPGGTSGYYRAC